MTDRTDPMYYEFDIQERKSGDTHRARMFCWWSGLASEAGLRRMCDCQLGGFFMAAKGNDFPTWENFRQGTKSGNANMSFVRNQNEWRKQHTCDCNKPSRRYAVLCAVTPGGDSISL